MGPRIWQGGCLSRYQGRAGTKQALNWHWKIAKKGVENKVDPGSLGVAMPQLFSTRRERESSVMG